MSVTFAKLANRVHDRLDEHNFSLPREHLQAIIQFTFFEIGDALASGEDVFLRGFGRFYPDYKPSRKIRSGLEGMKQEEFQTKRKVFVRFKPFNELNAQVQRYLETLGISCVEDRDGITTST